MSHKSQPLSMSVLTPYTGGHTVVYGNYIFELCPDHPKANPFGFVAQHRLVVERRLGYYLGPDIHVHHKDRNKTNNDPDNLHSCTRSEHLRLHREETRLRCQSPLTERSVHEALQCGSVKRAAAALGVHTETLRNRFPDLIAPFVRRSPTQIDDPAAIAKVLAVAPDDKRSYRDVAQQTGISYRTVQRICERNGIPWSRKSKKGEIHRTYRRRTTSLAA